MNKSLKAGFTMIETIMVLAVSAALLSIIMLTVKVSINRHRYEDNILGFKNFLQKQYDEANNVVIDKYDKAVREIGSCNEARGRNNCYVVGRLINIDLDSEGYAKATAEQIVYKANNTSVNEKLEYNDFNLVDKDELKEMGASIYATAKDEYRMEWETKLITPDGNKEIDKYAILIFKTPSSGTIRTYLLNKQIGTNNFNEIMHPDNLQKTVDFCVHTPNNNPFGPVRAVRVAGGAANASSVEVMSSDETEGVVCRKK